MKESLDIKSNIERADVVKDIDKNKGSNSDIICACREPYLPLPCLGEVKETFLTSIDYMISLNGFDSVSSELEIEESNEFIVNRESSIYSILDENITSRVKKLNDEEVTSIKDYTNKIFDGYIIKHLQQYHIQEVLKDIKEKIVHKFVELKYQKNNLIIQLYPNRCMKLKGTLYENSMSYCISLMWLVLINLCKTRTTDIDLTELLKQVFYNFNPIITKMVITTVRGLSSDGYTFVQELQQLTSLEKYITIKTSSNRVNIRWSPRADRFEDFIYKFYRKNTNDWEDEEVKDVQRDGNGIHCVKYDCEISKYSLVTNITVVGQNMMRDLTGYYTTQIYDYICNTEILKHYECATLFRILTGTKEHEEIFKRELMQTYEDVIRRKIKFLTSDSELYSDTSIESTKAEYSKSKRTKGKPLSEIYALGFKNMKESRYTANMVTFAMEEVKKKVFLYIETNNDLYIATQLVERFNLQRNIPKTIITVLKLSELDDKELEEKLPLIDRHKREHIKEMIEFVKANNKKRHILNEIYNYLWSERYI